MEAASAMSELRRLAAVAAQAPPTEDSLRDALEALRRTLGAHEIHLVYGEDESFRSISATDHGADALTSQVGLWIIQRTLVETGEPLGFELRGRRVERLAPAGCRVRRPWLAVPLPTLGHPTEMLLLRGPWRSCLPRRVATLLEAALPALSLLTSRVLDVEQAARKQKELNTLSELAVAITESRDMETVLTRLATTVATVSEHDFAVIDILKPGSDREVVLRCLNDGRFARTPQARLWKQWGLEHGLDPLHQQVARTGQAALYPDLQNDPRISPEMRAFFQQSLLVSAATLPLPFRDEVLGTISLASGRPRSYPPQEVEFLRGLAAQVTATVKAMQTFDELEESRAQLKQYAARLHEAMEEQHRLARTDSLTGIPNRRYVEEALETQCARAVREGSPLSVALADVDDFKRINDAYGHRAGDRALVWLARLAQRHCRSMDVVGRFGGDEFIFVLPLADLGQAEGFAHRLRSCIARKPPQVAPDRRWPVTVSLGVAQFKASDRGLDSVLQRADEALYQAKALGKDRVCTEEACAPAA